MKTLAATGEIGNPAIGNLQNLSGEGFFQKFVPSAIGVGFVIGVLVFFLTFIIGAIQWIASGGDKQALEGARGKITNALIGLLILFATFAIVKVIEKFFGISILAIDIGPLKIQ